MNGRWLRQGDDPRLGYRLMDHRHMGPGALLGQIDIAQQVLVPAGS